MPIKTDILAEAKNLGFLLAGVTLPDAPHHLEVYQAWLAAGHQGEMVYLASERAIQRRADPHLILPEARSILVLALPYPVPPVPAETDYGRTGQVAAYAWGRDYHDVIPARLARLVAFTETLLQRGIKWRGYTDTGPILERELAMRAGLGWIGKNTCLISPRHGSYFFLAELFWDVELEPDVPLVHDFCGSCRRCIEACPTGCILPDRTIDATRCISYLTIEQKTAISPGLRPMMENWLFGCDICQQVCPWNIRFASGSGDPELAPIPTVSRPDLEASLALSPQEFNQHFQTSPIRRPKRRGYLRNVAVALGNLADPETLPALAKCLKAEPEALVRAHAAWAIGQIGGKMARTVLQSAQAREEDPEVLSEIQNALQHC
jgi:epoxyqueuosine reductase